MCLITIAEHHTIGLISNSMAPCLQFKLHKAQGNRDDGETKYKKHSTHVHKLLCSDLRMRWWLPSQTKTLQHISFEGAVCCFFTTFWMLLQMKACPGGIPEAYLNSGLRVHVFKTRCLQEQPSLHQLVQGAFTICCSCSSFCLVPGSDGPQCPFCHVFLQCYYALFQQRWDHEHEDGIKQAAVRRRSIKKLALCGGDLFLRKHLEFVQNRVLWLLVTILNAQYNLVVVFSERLCEQTLTPKKV